MGSNGFGRDGVEEGGSGIAGQVGRHHQESLKVDGDILERGLKELIPSLCAFLRGHTEVSSWRRVGCRKSVIWVVGGGGGSFFC